MRPARRGNSRPAHRVGKTTQVVGQPRAARGKTPNASRKSLSRLGLFARTVDACPKVATAVEAALAVESIICNGNIRFGSRLRETGGTDGRESLRRSTRRRSEPCP
ncbi:hypothetical protein Mpe_A2828 [Methylibium petroleiphilum PM1]|uniref:Uncharacterized protein n=1 Tax=Methylibium petroleiphilum (strain ATCC BAA-1232 / LMG 22953 / PM1) TaxID=420662 RepID=A2SJP3_METPP|nr:hypothetical protein Mpe_A2828 [Methylibium petroleiphilum PM1]